MGILRARVGGQWVDIGQGPPSGGTTGQVLTKNSATDGDVSWKSPNGAITQTTAIRRGGGVVDVVGSGGFAWCHHQISGDKCFFNINYNFGTTGAVANAGITTFDAPVPMANSTIQVSYSNLGSGLALQGAARFTFQVLRNGAANAFEFWSTAQWTSAFPGSVTFGNEWRFNGWYWV